MSKERRNEIRKNVSLDNSTILQRQLNWMFERVVAKTKAVSYVNLVNAAALSKNAFQIINTCAACTAPLRGPQFGF